MKRSTLIGSTVVVLVVVALVLRWENRHDLRGYFEPSDDGKSYLIVADKDTGGGGQTCEPVFIDEKQWPHRVGNLPF